jgi:sugar phosphate isomerase/epimerase
MLRPRQRDFQAGAAGPAIVGTSGLPLRRFHPRFRSGVQLALVPLLDDPANWSGAADLLRSEGIEVVSGMMETVGEDYGSLESIARTGGVRPDATWPSSRRRAGAVAELAEASGIDLVTFHAGFIPEGRDDAERGTILDRLRELAVLFAGHGIDVALETGQETAPTLAAALDELDAPNVGVNFDPANMILYAKGNPVEAIRGLAPRVRQVHVKDARPTDVPGTWGSEVPVGEGAVDWHGFLAEITRMPRPVGLVIEREAGDDRDGDVRRAIELLGREEFGAGE